MPGHPIVIPPDSLAPGTPSHPIYIPPPQPAHPIVIPPDAISPGVPSHPIYIPPPVPAHPIVIPPPTPPTEGEDVLIEWHAAWTPQTGWIVVGVPTGPVPTPSKK
jgi:hypothetical protein